MKLTVGIALLWKYLKQLARLGPLHTRYFCIQYCNILIEKTKCNKEPHISMTHQGKLLRNLP
jgi:hypothetical protein